MGGVIQLKSRSEESDMLSDAVLLAACGNGDTAALGTLFRRHNRTVYRFLARMAPLDHGCLDDLVQNTFLAARESAHRYRGKSAVVTWLLAISANILKNHIRSETRRRKAIETIKEMPMPPGDSPEKRLEQQLMMSQLARQLNGMSHKLKVVFVMCDLEGIPGTDVARTLNLREGTVWRRLHEARKQLRLALSKQRGEGR
jgi:RNA polymerase sigma-70 factor, ECF subfamily